MLLKKNGLLTSVGLAACAWSCILVSVFHKKEHVDLDFLVDFTGPMQMLNNVSCPKYHKVFESPLFRILIPGYEFKIWAKRYRRTSRK